MVALVAVAILVGLVVYFILQQSSDTLQIEIGTDVCEQRTGTVIHAH